MEGYFVSGQYIIKNTYNRYGNKNLIAYLKENDFWNKILIFKKIWWWLCSRKRLEEEEIKRRERERERERKLMKEMSKKKIKKKN